MTEPTVVEQAPIPTESIIDSDIHDDILSTLDSVDVTPKAKKAADIIDSSATPAEDTVESMLESGVLTLKKDDTPDEDPVVEPEKPEPEPVKEAISPEDLMDDALSKPDAQPDDLLDDAEVSKVISGKKAQNAFKKERAYNKELRQKVAQLEEAVQKSAAAEQDLEELTELKAKTEGYETQIKSLEDQIGQVDLSRSPQFRQQYDDKINSAAGKMVQLLVAEQLSSEDASAAVREILSAPNLHVREEIIEDTAPGIRGALSAHAISIDEIQQARGTALTEWKASAAALEESASKERLAEMSGHIGEVVSEAVDKVVELGNPYYKQTTNDEWNQQVGHRVDALKGLLLEGDYGKLALYVAEGLVADDLRSRHLLLMQKAKDLESQLSDVVKSGPSFQGTTPQGGNAPAQQEITLGNGTLEDEIANLLGK